MVIDAVYTWVNHEDKNWKNLFEQTIRTYNSKSLPSATSDSRFTNRNEIYYSINALIKFAPWINKIFVVSNCTLPEEILSINKVVSVPHESVFLTDNHLPTFNSLAIESNLHHIEGLSDHYLYFNDDIFLCKPTQPEDFFHSEEVSYFFPSRHKALTNRNKFRPIDYNNFNAQNLLSTICNVKVTHKLEHSVFPIQREIMYELEKLFSDEFKTTSANRFRADNDIPPTTALYAYYSFAINRGIPKKIKSRYIDIASPLFPLLTHRFSPLRRGKYLSMCLNEVFPIRYFNKARNAYVQHVMEKMFED